MTEYNLGVIYDLLEESFDQAGIDVLAFKLFPDLRRNLSNRADRSSKIQKIIDYAGRYGRIPDLLAYVQQENPTQYQKYLEKFGPDSRPPSPTPLATPSTALADETNSRLFLWAILGTLVVVVGTALVMRFILEIQNGWWFVLVLGIEFPFILVIIGKLTGQNFLTWLKTLFTVSRKEDADVRK